MEVVEVATRRTRGCVSEVDSDQSVVGDYVMQVLVLR